MSCTLYYASEEEVSHSPILLTSLLTINSPGCDQLEDPRMGLAAGGRITQKIYEDTRDPNMYDVEASERLCIHTLSTTAWEVMYHLFLHPVAIGRFIFFLTLLQKITGVIPPMTPIVPGSE